LEGARMWETVGGGKGSSEKKWDTLMAALVVKVWRRGRYIGGVRDGG